MQDSRFVKRRIVMKLPIFIVEDGIMTVSDVRSGGLGFKR